MSKNISKGICLEVAHSRTIHRLGVPLLVSPSFLRKIGAGQLDLAVICHHKGEKVIKIYEVKSTARVAHAQQRRLKRSAQLLSQILGLPAQIYLLSGLPKW